MEAVSLRQTIKNILDEHLNHHDGILLGECVSDPGGVAGTIPESENVIDLPMTEIGGADFAVGCALAGRRPVFVVRFQDFMLMNGSPFIAFAATCKQMHGLTAPVFIRALANDHFDATHSNVLHSTFMHFPGFKVAAPCTPGEYTEVWNSFLADDIPYYVSEYRDDFDNTNEFEDVIDDDADINLFGISVCRQYMYKARDILLSKGIKANVVNIMWLKPFDSQIAVRALEKVKKGLVIDPGHVICGASETIAYRLMKESSGSYIDVLGIEDKIKTTNPNNWNEVPHEDKIVDKVMKIMCEG